MSNPNPSQLPAPIGSTQRIDELDILRGFALLGVFIVHFVGAGFRALPIDPSQAALFQQSTANQAALFLSDMFFYDKANTLFAALFGMGFWVMMQRLETRAKSFSKVYIRRHVALYVLGIINLFFIFPGDILHEYALLGLLLFLVRNVRAGVMLGAGLLLALAAKYVEPFFVPDIDAAWKQFDDIQAAAFKDGGYWNWVWQTSQAHVRRDLIEGAALGWFLYIFSRFLLGAWIMRQGWLQRSCELLPRIRVYFPITLLTGLALEGLSMAILEGALDGPMWLEKILHVVGTPILAAGYALGLIVLFHSRWSNVTRVFAPVGRMALTAYVCHGAIFTLLYFPFGLDLLGQISPALAMVIALFVYASLTLMCYWWLKHYQFGPLEYFWRWATYGRRPNFRRVASHV